MKFDRNSAPAMRPSLIRSSIMAMAVSVRDFERLAQQAQADINSYIDQIQIVAATAPELDADVNAMLDSMACEMLCVSQKHSGV